MYQITTSVQKLINALRGTDMPWIGDEIEAHVRLGRRPLFESGKDDAPHGLEMRNDVYFRDDAEQYVAPKDILIEGAADESNEFSQKEQVDEAVRILLAHIEVRVNFVDDANECLKTLRLPDVGLRVVDDEGEEMVFFTDDARNAACELSEKIYSLKEWLESEL
jgi:hypothetical protein